MTDEYFTTRPHIEQAVYKTQTVRAYQNNPTIEALPLILSQAEAIRQLTWHVDYQPEDRLAPMNERIHMVRAASQFFHPSFMHVELEQRASRMLRQGYLGQRNAFSEYYHRDLNHRISAMDLNQERRDDRRFFGQGSLMAGISGIGKSTAFQRIFSLYPQVIDHTNYKGTPFSKRQVVSLILQCPHDSSTRGLCRQFLVQMGKLVGKNYEELYAKPRESVDDLLRSMTRVAELHSLGVLVIDEIQVLNQAKSGGREQMLNFFLQLVNEIGLPVVLIGTYQAYQLFDNNLRLGRRGTGEGTLDWDRMQPTGDWDEFVEALWRYQYLRRRVELSKDLNRELYEQSQGITDLAVKLYIFAQIRAITTAATPDEEVLTCATIRSVAADSFSAVMPVLAKLRTGDPNVIKTIEDVCRPSLDQFIVESRRAARKAGR